MEEINYNKIKNKRLENILDKKDISLYRMVVGKEIISPLI